MLQTYQETRRRFFDHPSLRIEGAAARAARNCRTPQVLTAQLQIVLTLRGAFVYERGSSHSLLTANHALLIAPGDESCDRFVDDQPLDYMLVTPHVDAAAGVLGEAAAAGLAKSVRDTRVCGASVQLQRSASSLWNLCLHERSRDEIEIEQCVVELMSCIAHAAGAPSLTQTSSASPRRAGRGQSALIGAVKELIGTGREPQSLTSIAAQLDISPAYLTDRFRRHEGISIARY